MGVSGHRHTPAALIPGKTPGTLCTAGWVDLRAGLEGAENLSPGGIRSVDRPARSKLIPV
jgi:hypothetical protein